MRLVILAAALWALIAALPASANILLVPSQYPTIQSAVNAAQPGDTVRVSPKSDGTPYQESVSITTNDIRLEGDQAPILDGGGSQSVVDSNNQPIFGSGDGINVNADGVTVCGFVVQNYYYFVPINPIPRLACGVYIAPNHTGDIHDNTLQHNGNGLEL